MDHEMTGSSLQYQKSGKECGFSAVNNMRHGIRNVFGIVLRNWSTLLCFEMIYRWFGFVFLFPFVRFLVSLLPSLAGETYLGQENIWAVFRHPAAILLLLAVLLLAGFYIYFEIIALILYSNKGWQRTTVSVWGLWKETVRKALSFFSLRRLPVFLLLPLIMLSVFALTSGYLRMFQIPEFILEFMIGDPILLWVFVFVIVILHVILFFYLLGFPSLILNKNTFLQSFKESLSLLRGKKLKILVRFAAYVVLFQLFMAAAAFLAAGILAGSVRLFHPPSDWRSVFQFYFLKWESVWQIAAGVFLSVFLCTVMVVFYHQYRNDIRPACVKSQWSFRHFGIRLFFTLITVIALLIFSETEIAAQTWYPKPSHTIFVAHRAGATFAPENTVAALNQSIKDGADMAEIDVQQLKDGTLIVMHDTNFKRTTGTDLNVWDADYETVRELDAGSGYSYEYSKERVPTLKEMLTAAKDNIQLMIELKSTGHEKELVRQTLDEIYEAGMQDQCMIASMSLDLLKEAKELRPEIKTVYISVLLLSRQYDLDYLDAYSIETTSLSAGLVGQAHYQNKQVYAWTANSERSIQKILRSRADGLVTDNIPLAKYEAGDIGWNFILNQAADFFFPDPSAQIF